MYTRAVTVPNDELVVQVLVCACAYIYIYMYTGAFTAPNCERVLSQHINVMYFSSACLCASMRTNAILATKIMHTDCIYTNR